MLRIDGVRDRRLRALYLHQEEGEHRNNGERHNQRGKKCIRDGQSKGEEELADQPTHDAEWQEDRNRGDGGACDRRCNLARAAEHRFTDRLALAAMSVDVFEYHDGVVNHATDRYCEAAEGHDIDRDPRGGHQNDCRQDA